ncbi:serine protease [Evansella sp. AB-P1]|uniref:serine protease n=1 Tax=Evansella sp. AB-P1 TaxID=3037653 RepID=UPI00241EBE68|nr:serine protease [Evansella sp. AB-P1]MDG5786729.1 serine protease [Evansella sp. AB-P1]
MKDVQEIKKVIGYLHEEINSLENHLKNIQDKCDHQYEENNYYKKCTKCQQIKVLYF